MCECVKAPFLPRTVRLLINGGDNMLGRAVQLTLRHQSPREEFIQDSLYAIHYLVKGTKKNTMTARSQISSTARPIFSRWFLLDGPKLCSM